MPLQLLDFESLTVSAKQSGSSSNQMTESECRHHIDKLKILNLVANLNGEPSPDDYEKDICVLISEEKPMNGTCVQTNKENGHLNNGVVDWINSVEHDPSQLDTIARISPSLSPAKTETSPVKVSNGNVHSISDVNIMASVSKPQENVDVKFTDKSSENVTEQDENEDVFLDSSKDAMSKLAEPVKEKRVSEGSEDQSDRKTVKTCNSSVTSSECQSSSQYSTLKRKKRNSDGCKPPNVLVYSESNDIRANVISTIKQILHPDRYTIYELKSEQLKNSFWIDNTTLLIVCGPISPQFGSVLMEYFLCGGKMLCLCSDVLNMVLPIYRTAEVRESELVQFSYRDWHRIQLMHHIFCYHPSPIKKHFSLDEPEGQHKP